MRALYVFGTAYVVICGALFFHREPPKATPAPAPAPNPTRPHPTAVRQPSNGREWFEMMKQFCNPVEVETQQHYRPAPTTQDGAAYSAACYALAGKIEKARDVIEALPPEARSFAAGVVFGVGHPVADAGDDKSAGPIMELVLDYQPDNYMALYHAGMSEYALGQLDLSRVHLQRFIELYHENDGWRSNALTVLQRLGSE